MELGPKVLGDYRSRSTIPGLSPRSRAQVQRYELVEVIQTGLRSNCPRSSAVLE